MLDDLVQVFQSRAEQQGIGFTYEAITQLPVGVRGDEKKLRQVLINLLGNAIKFTPEGGVAIRVGYREERMRFEVEDTGSGIPEESLEEIFEAFRHVEDQVDGHTEGTGLGLPISLQLVQLLGGELRVESELGKGSRFWFDLMLEELPGFASNTNSDERTVIGFTGDECRVLVADDQQENRQVLVEMLTPLGFEVREAVDGRDSVDQGLAWRPDLLLMDLRMPKLDGNEAIRQLRQSLAGAPMVLVVVSASAFEEDRQKSIDAGADDFLPKPFREQHLLDLLQRHLGLEWEYSQDAEEERETSAETQLVPPPAAELSVWMELALAGNVLGLRQRAESLSERDARHSEYCRRLIELARGFKVDEIQAFIGSLQERQGS